MVGPRWAPSPRWKQARATSPPTHTVAETRWIARALTPLMWSSAAEEWPVSASGSRASSDPAQPHARTALLSDPAHAMTTTSTTTALMRFIRSVGRSHRTAASWVAKPGWPTGTPARSAKVRTMSSRRLTSHSVPEVAATRPAVHRRRVRVVSGSTKAPRSRKPTVTAAARSWTPCRTGSPQRTSAPGSPAA